MSKRRYLLVSIIVLVLLGGLCIDYVYHHLRRPYSGAAALIDSNSSNSSSSLKKYTYPSVVRLTLTQVHTDYRPEPKIGFVLSVRPLTYVPENSTTGQGTFTGSGVKHIKIVGTIVSSAEQLKAGVYVYELHIPPAWRMSIHSSLYLLANYALVSPSKPSVIEGYSTTYQVLNPSS